MGQYFKIINVDKKQQLKPNDFSNFRKLMEFSYEGNLYIMALYKLLETKWKGDRVYLTGDYDDEINDYHKDSCYYETYQKLEKEFKTESLYDLSDKWKALKEKNMEEMLLKNYYKRIYNTETKQYIDLTNLPVEFFYEGYIDVKKHMYYEPEFVSVSPLPLLITFGNGAGGSFYSEDERKMNLVGSWCEYTKGIIVSREIIKEYEDSFVEFRPDFSENRIPIDKLKGIKTLANKMITHEEGIKILNDKIKKWKEKVDRHEELRKILDSNNFSITFSDNTNLIIILDKETAYETQLNFKQYTELIDVKYFLESLKDTINNFNVQSKFDSYYKTGTDSKKFYSNIEKNKSNLEKLSDDIERLLQKG